MWLPVVNSWRLNERHYGALQGLNKAETAAEVRRGAGQAVAPQLRRSAARPRPTTTSASRAATRAMPAWPTPSSRAASRSRTPWPGSSRSGTSDIAPALRAGQAGPGGGPRQQPAGAREVPRRHLRRGRSSASTSRPACRSSTTSTTVSGRVASRYLGDPEQVAAAMAAVAAQGKREARLRRGRPGRAVDRGLCYDPARPIAWRIQRQ